MPHDIMLYVEQRNELSGKIWGQKADRIEAGFINLMRICAKLIIDDL
ncbi:MAG: hypothetical protein R2865_10795 [Deinococcales bacterium]